MGARLYLVVCIFVLIPGMVWGKDRVSEKQVSRLLEELLDNTQHTWIKSGTIKATHMEYRAPRTTDETQIQERIIQETQQYKQGQKRPQQLQEMHLQALPFNIRYRLSNEYTMGTSHCIYLDDGQFSYQRDIVWREDSVRLPTDLRYNCLTREFKLMQNLHYECVWDGRARTDYVTSMNYAMVDTRDVTLPSLPEVLTVGRLPWGRGSFSREGLQAAQVSAVYIPADGQHQIQMTLVLSDGKQAVVVLDQAKDNAVMSYSLETRDDSIMYTTLSNYTCIAGQWIPRTIYIERRGRHTGRSTATDLWQFQSIDPGRPEGRHMNACYAPQVQIEFFSPLMDESLIYSIHEGVNTDALLDTRLRLAVEAEAPNCGVACLHYIAAKLKMDIHSDTMHQFLDAEGNMSLANLVDLATSWGMSTRAVRTGFDTLQDLSGTHVILHLPGKNHFVVLEGMDEKQAWFLDLTRRRFYYPISIDLLKAETPEIVALLVADRPSVAWNALPELSPTELATVKGAKHEDCTILAQHRYYVYCAPIWGPCDLQDYEYHPERWKCEDFSGGCTEYLLPWAFYAACYEDPFYPNECVYDYDWYDVIFLPACN